MAPSDGRAAGEKAEGMHQLRLTPNQLAGIRQTVDATVDGAGAAWGDEPVHVFSLRVEAGVEGELRGLHARATDTEISSATAAYWAEVLDAVCQLWTPRACAARGRPGLVLH
jgi:hypothetical protein